MATPAPFRLLRSAYGGLSGNVWLLALVMFINRSGTMVIPFLTVYLTIEKKFDLEQAGLIMSAFGVGSLLGSWLGGWLTDKIGAYAVQIWSLVGTGLLFFWLGQLEQFWPLCLGVFLLSTVSDAYRPASLTAVGSYSKPENLTRSLSLVRMAINLGWSIGPAIGGFFAAHLGYSWLFIADGATCLLAAVVLRLFLPPRRSRIVEKESETEQNTDRPPYKDITFVVFSLTGTIVALCFMQFLFTLPVYLKQDLSLNEDQIGLLLAFNGLLVALLEVTLVYVLENRFPRLILCAFGAFLISLAYLTLTLQPQIVLLAIVSMTLLTFGEIFNFPFANSFALTRASRKTKGQYMAFFTMSFALANIIAPSFGFYIAGEYGFRVLWFTIGGLGILATIGILLVSRMENRMALKPRAKEQEVG